MEIGVIATSVIGLIFGILFRSFVDMGMSFVAMLIFISAAIYLVSGRSWTRLCALFFIAMSMGILRYDMVDSAGNLSYLQNLDGQNMEVEGVIIEEPKEKDKSATLIVSAVMDSHPEFNVLVMTKPYIKFAYGDRVKIFGRIEKIINFSDDFDYVAYLAKDEIYYQFLNPKITFVSAGNGSYLREKLFNFKNRFMEKLDSVISEPESSLLGGIILGAKSSLDTDLTNDFKRVGLIHIIALSGYNVSVVADSLMKMIWFLPMAVRLAIGSVAIILFALMTGGGSTVVRASFMVLLAILARATGRIYLVGSALLVAAVAMILYDPKILVFDTSFQLSFLATAGLIFFTPILEKKLAFVPEKFNLRGMLVSTLAAQLAVWPLILYKMGNFSLVSIPANLLVGPILPITMFFGFMTGFAGFVSHYLSMIIALVSYPLLFYIVKVAEIFAALPFASVTISSFPLFATIAIYVAYFAAIL